MTENNELSHYKNIVDELKTERMINDDMRKYPVMDKPCKSCPFEGDEPIQLRPERQVEIYRYIANFECQHICHTVRNPVTICRGGRNLQIKIAYALGWIKENSDDEFKKMIDKSVEKNEK